MNQHNSSPPSAASAAWHCQAILVHFSSCPNAFAQIINKRIQMKLMLL
jgi:hypothetical protein